MGPAKREYLLTGHTPNPPRQRRHERFPFLFSQSECRQWSEGKTSMGVIFLLPSSKMDSAKNNPATLGGSVVQCSARGMAFHAAMAADSSESRGPRISQSLQTTKFHTPTSVLPQCGHGNGFSSRMSIPPPHPRPGFEAIPQPPQPRVPLTNSAIWTLAVMAFLTTLTAKHCKSFSTVAPVKIICIRTAARAIPNFHMLIPLTVADVAVLSADWAGFRL